MNPPFLALATTDDDEVLLLLLWRRVAMVEAVAAAVEEEDPDDDDDEDLAAGEERRRCCRIVVVAAEEEVWMVNLLAAAAEGVDVDVDAADEDEDAIRPVAGRMRRATRHGRDTRLLRPPFMGCRVVAVRVGLFGLYVSSLCAVSARVVCDVVASSPKEQKKKKKKKEKEKEKNEGEGEKHQTHPKRKNFLQRAQGTVESMCTGARLSNGCVFLQVFMVFQVFFDPYYLIYNTL